MRFENENWILVRRVNNIFTGRWHPATDNALGSESYGTNQKNDPIGPYTFSVKYDTFQWDKILFATEDLSYFIILEKFNKKR